MTDVSDESKCIRIKLFKGGSLLVNRDNINQLLMSISMFSAKDQGLIMQAVMKDKIATEARLLMRIDDLLKSIEGFKNRRKNK